jgi:hypothetical protein
MPEIGEEVSIEQVISTEHDEACYFCNARQEPRTEVNDLGDDYDEDEDLDGPPGGHFKNDAGRLGRALGSSTALEIKVDGVAHAVLSAAHHLIPGNASLRKSALFKSRYLWKDGEARGNIGYNVNSGPNGVWLPGNYAMRPWMVRSPEFQRQYAYAAMLEARAQFHDAHERYSEFVLNGLNKIHDKLEAIQTLWCPEQGKRVQEGRERNPEEDNPLYSLVARLHTVSSRMRSLLTGSPKDWKRNVWTSRFALELMNAPGEKDD